MKIVNQSLPIKTVTFGSIKVGTCFCYVHTDGTIDKNTVCMKVPMQVSNNCIILTNYSAGHYGACSDTDKVMVVDTDLLIYDNKS
jgi:hypothetical protein